MKTQDNRIAALRNMDASIDANVSALPPAAASSARTAVKAFITELGHHGSKRETNRRSAIGITERLDRARRVVLTEHMTPIVRLRRRCLLTRRNSRR